MSIKIMMLSIYVKNKNEDVPIDLQDVDTLIYRGAVS